MTYQEEKNTKLDKHVENTLENSIVHKINDHFKTPIYYNNDKVELKKHIVSDLELTNTIDETCNPIYSYCFNTDNDVSTKITEQITKYYTTDVLFLQDNQKLIKEYTRPETRYTQLAPN